ncbi:MAG: hypothetical protein AAFX87_18825 [Bacteroidota bacterium]
MKEQLKKWQNEWRQIMGKPTDVDVEPDCDFDLHFDIWTLGKETFYKLFEGFPKGAEIADRAFQLRWGDLPEFNKALTEEELIDEVKKSIDILQQICPSDDLSNPQISIESGDDKLRLDLLSQTDPLSIEVDDELSTLIKKASGEEGYNAYFFLREPMYRLSNSQITRNWVLWALTGSDNLNPYTPLLKLEFNGCDAALTDQGVLIFKLIN